MFDNLPPRERIGMYVEQIRELAKLIQPNGDDDGGETTVLNVIIEKTEQVDELLKQLEG